MMCLTEQKTERLIKLSKKDLMIMLEPYTDDSLICIGLQMQQGYVGFFDLEQDTKHKDKYVFVLNSDCFNEWYEKDIAELKEKISEQQATITKLKELNDDKGKKIISLIRTNKTLKKENEQLRQSIDSMIETSAEISNRNVLLHEQLGETQFNHKQCEKKVKELEQKLDWICEQTGYDGVKFHYINKEVVQ